jgi:hypothetical protein
MDLVNQTYLDRVEQITAAQVNDDDSIIFVGLDNPKKIAGKITDNDISMKLMTTGQKPQFAAPKKKPKNCSSPTSISCGLTCLPAKTKAGKDTLCKKPLSLNQKAQKKSITDTAKKSKQTAEGAKNNQILTPEQKTLEAAKELKKNNPSISESDFNAKADLILKIESRATQSEGDSAYKAALVAKEDPHSSEAALDRVNSLYRARNEIQKKGQLSDDRLRDIPHDFGQGMRGGSVQGINLAAASYTAEIWDNLSEPAKNKFIEHWQEYSKGRTASDQLGKNSGFAEVLKSKKIKSFVGEIDRRVGLVNA